MIGPAAVATRCAAAAHVACCSFAVLALAACGDDGAGAGELDAGEQIDASRDAELDSVADITPDATDAARDAEQSVDAADAVADAALDGADADAAADADVVGPDRGHAFLRDGFLNIAHRGGGRMAPEETLAAYENAVAIGVDVIEIDVHSTADGVIVCMHDDTVDRTTDGTGRIQSLTFEQLRALDAGYEFTPDGGTTYPFRGTGVVVPTMDEVLTAFPDALIALEIKQMSPPIVDEVVALIEEHDAVGRMVVASFDDATISAVRARNPRILTAMAAGEMLRFAQLDERTLPRYTPPALVVQAPESAADAELVDRAHSLGMRVHLWTINDRQAMVDAVALGVDGIFTDNPALLAEVLGEGSGEGSGSR